MCNRTEKKPRLKASPASPQGNFLSRRNVIISTLAIYYTTLIRAEPVKAEEDDQRKVGENNEQDGGILGAIKSIFDPNEKTKSGKVLPKAYLKSAREVVKTLRESLEEDTNDIAKFRRSADAAKESIREYLSGWRGQMTVTSEVNEISLHIFLKIWYLQSRKIRINWLFFFIIRSRMLHWRKQ
jgi:Photosystem II Pbs27